jgi:hypothetical protein
MCNLCAYVLKSREIVLKVKSEKPKAKSSDLIAGEWNRKEVAQRIRKEKGMPFCWSK